MIKDTPPVSDQGHPTGVGVGKTPEEKVAEAEDDQELNTHAYDLFCVWRRMSRDDEESDDAITAAWDAMDPELKLHFFEQARIARFGGEADVDVTLHVVRKELESTADPDTDEAARAPRSPPERRRTRPREFSALTPNTRVPARMGTAGSTRRVWRRPSWTSTTRARRWPPRKRTARV